MVYRVYSDMGNSPVRLFMCLILIVTLWVNKCNTKLYKSYFL